MIGLLTVLGALLLGARAQQEEFGLVGSDVTLVPKYTGDLKEIEWLLNDRILVEIMLKPEEKIIDDLTNDRTTINKANGVLTIKNLTIEDSGDYKAEVILMDNSVEVTEIRLTVRDCPDQPSIKVQSTEDQFVVSCESFSPDVTYEWFNQTRSVSESQLYAEPKKNGTLTCVVDNKVCNKSSSINFYTPDQPHVKSEGNEVILIPEYTGDLSEIIWKVNGDDLVEMMLKPGVHNIFHRLKDRVICETDGRLFILELTTGDSGNYTALILVNNEYYYTEIRLTVLGREYRDLSGGEKAGIVIGVLFLIFLIIFLWDCCCRRPNQRENEQGQEDEPLIGKSKGPNQRENEQGQDGVPLVEKGEDDNIVENGNAAPAVDGNMEGHNQRKNEQGQDGEHLIPEGKDENDGDDDNIVENGNAAPAPAAANGNMEGHNHRDNEQGQELVPLIGEGVNGDKNENVEKGIAADENVGCKDST